MAMATQEGQQANQAVDPENREEKSNEDGDEFDIHGAEILTIENELKHGVTALKSYTVSAVYDREAAGEDSLVTDMIRDYVDAIVGTDRKVESLDQGMILLRNVPKIETGEVPTSKRSIIVRKCTEKLFIKAISLVEHKKRYRVAIVGTPGTGKSTTTAVLIRMLLFKGNTVVYHIMRKRGNQRFYEMVPSKREVRCRVIKASLRDDLGKVVPSLDREDTYYIVDPGRSEMDCVPERDLKAKFILIMGRQSVRKGHRWT